MDNGLLEDTCLQNSSAVTLITGNRMGFLSSGDIEVRGGKSLHFIKNIIEFVQEKSIKVMDIRTIVVSENYFGLPISISFSGLTPRCVDGPLPYSTIQSIAFTTNLAARPAGPLLSLEHSFSQDLSGSKLVISGNTILAPCMCG